MKKKLQMLLNLLPSILISLMMAITVWIVAISEKDPAVERRFTNQINVEVVGLSSGLVMTNSIPETINVTLRAPESVWQKITNDRITGKAIIDVTGYGQGDYNVPIQLAIDVSPIQVVSFTPSTTRIILEEYATREFEVRVTEVGDIATAFMSEPPVVDPPSVIVGGSVSILDQVDFLRVILDHSNKTEPISTDLNVAAIGKTGTAINAGLTYTPSVVNVKQNIQLRGGYRVVVVKVVTTGSVPEGYRVSKISVDPSVVTIYSSDPELLSSIPSYMETDPLDLTEFSGDVSVKLGLQLPDGVQLVGDQSVKVEIEIRAIEDARTYSDIPVYIVGLDDSLETTISPGTVDIYVSGPQPILNLVITNEIYAVIDLHGYTAGHYQVSPSVKLGTAEGLKIQSIIPDTIDLAIRPRTGKSVPDPTGIPSSLQGSPPPISPETP
jgi:YbbR domain-containing protein